jgi:EmrB/QacA subfamily drug resistance transporter
MPRQIKPALGYASQFKSVTFRPFTSSHSGKRDIAQVPAPPSPPPASGELTHRQRLFVIVGLVLAMFLAALDQTILGTVLPSIADQLGGGTEISWVISAYLLSATVTTPIYGKLSDLYGRRALLRIAILLFVIASVLCALATTLAQLIAARLLQGVGAGGLVTMALATMADIVSPRERGRYQGYNASAWILASVMGPVVGGLFAEYLSWRYVFWLNLPAGLAALAAAHFGLKVLPVRRVRHRIDYLGALLIMAAASCVMLVVTLGGADLPWQSPAIIGLASGALALTVFAIIQERFAPEPIFAPHLFHNRAYIICNLVSMLSAVAFVGAMAYLPVYFQLVHGASATDSGLMVVPSFLLWPIVSVFASRAVTTTGRYKIFPIIGAALALVSVLLLAFTSAHTPLVIVLTLTTIMSIGAGAVGPIVMLAAQNAVEPRDLGSATGGFSFSRNLGASFGVALLGTIAVAGMDWRVKLIPGSDALGLRPGVELLRAGTDAIARTPEAIREPVISAMAASFSGMFLTAAAALALALLAVLYLKEVPLRTTSPLAERAEAVKRAAE